MSASSIATWALPQLSRLLPLDEDSLTQIITYTLTLPKSESAEHLKNLLGDSPQALEFITSFNARRRDNAASSKSATPRNASPATRNARDDTDAPPRRDPNRQKKAKTPLHNAGPARRPENFGNITGGYKKADIEEDYMAGGSGGHRAKAPAQTQTQAGASGMLDTLTLSDRPAAVQAPRTASSSPFVSPGGSANVSRTASPAPASSNVKSRAPPSASGNLISEFMPNVKSKAKAAKGGKGGTGSGTSTPRGGHQATTTTSSINDLTSAIAALELSTNPALSSEKRSCNCNGSIHPLFTPAPNCLACGKIICALEGLQPCSFCGEAILSPREIQEMIHELRQERGSEKTRVHNEGMHHDRGPGPAPSHQYASSNPVSSATALASAKAHRDKLLSFQSNNAQRTRVYDEAADFDTPLSAGGSATQWMTPAQRALALKKQQKMMREMEEKNRPEYEKRGKMVMSLDVRGGKVIRRFEHAAEEAIVHDDHIEEQAGDAQPETSADANATRGNAFGRNPLLAAGGLVRPVWKPQEDTKGKGKAREERPKSNWGRVVQDDKEDNEEWILDGGVYGGQSLN